MVVGNEGDVCSSRTLLTSLIAVPVAIRPLKLLTTETTLNCSFRAPGNPGEVRLDNVIDPVLSDEHWLNPRI